MNRFLISFFLPIALLNTAYAEPLDIVIVSPTGASGLDRNVEDLGYFIRFINPASEGWYPNEQIPRVNYDLEQIKEHLLGLLDGSLDYAGSNVTVLEDSNSINELNHAYTNNIPGFADNGTLESNQYDVAIIINDPSLLTIVPVVAFEGVSNLSNRLLEKGTDVYLFEPDLETFRVSPNEMVHRIANGCGIDVIPVGETLRQSSSYFEDKLSSMASYITAGSIFSTVTGSGVSAENSYQPSGSEFNDLNRPNLEADINEVIASEKAAEHYTTSFNGQGKVFHRPLDLTQAPFNSSFRFAWDGTSSENQIRLSITELINDHYLADGEHPITPQLSMVGTSRVITSEFLPLIQDADNNHVLGLSRSQQFDIGDYDENGVNQSNMLALTYARQQGIRQGPPEGFDDSLQFSYSNYAFHTANAYRYNGYRIPSYSIYARFCSLYPDVPFVFDGVHQINETIDAVAAAYVTSSAGIDFENDELNRLKYYREADPFFIGWNTVMQQAYLSQDRQFTPDVNIDITTLSLPTVSANTPLNLNLGVTGGTAPYIWEELTGNLPDGVDLHSDGKLQGNAVDAGGSYQLVFKVTDANGAFHKQALELTSAGYGLDSSLYGWDTRYCFDTGSNVSLISGDVITALNGGNTDVSLNGITFSSYDLGGGFKNSYVSEIRTTGNSAYDELLGSLSEGSQNEEVITLTGLTTGEAYRLQVFYNNKNDDDGYASQMHAWIDGYAVEVQLHAEDSSAVGGDYGSYAVANFIASGSEVQLRLKAQSETASIKGTAAFNALLLTKPEVIEPHEGISRYAEITWTTPQMVTDLDDFIEGSAVHALNGGGANISIDELGVVFRSENIGYNNNQTTSITNGLANEDFALLMSQQTRTDFYHSLTFDGFIPGREYQIQVFNKSTPLSDYKSIAGVGYHSSDTDFGLYKQGSERIYADGEVMQSVGTFTARSANQVLEMRVNDASSVNHISFSAIYIVEVPGQEDDDLVVSNMELTVNGRIADFSLDGESLNGHPLTYSIVRAPFYGELVGTPPNLIYHAGVDFAEQDVFTYTVSNGLTTSHEVSVTLEAAGVAPLAHWSMDDGSGSVVTDNTGNGHDGTLTGGTWQSEGQVSGAIMFDAPGLISVPKTAFALIDDEVTIVMWLYASTDQKNLNRSLRALDSNGNRVFETILPTFSSIVLWDAGIADANSTSFNRTANRISEGDFEGEWNHWAFTLNTSTGIMEIYLNGALWASEEGQTTTLNTVETAFLASRDESGVNYYSGSIDEVSIYNKALSAQEISDLCLLGYTPPPVLSGYQKWVVNNTNNTEVRDTTTAGDSDQDGIVNLLEYALNGDSGEADSQILPTVEKVGDSFAFSFERNLDAREDTTTIFQYSTSLLSDDWTDVELTAPEVSLGAELDGMQAVDVMISDDMAVDDKLFGRIKVIYDN